MNWRSTIVCARGGRVDIILIQYLINSTLRIKIGGMTEVPITIVLKPTVDLNAVTQEITEIVQE